MTLVLEEVLRIAREAKTRIRQVSPSGAKALLDSGALLLDVRESEEFATGHLQGAANACVRTLFSEIHALAPDLSRPIVCYCGGGNRGAIAADSLQTLGYQNVVSIEGGLNACGIATPTPAHAQPPAT